MRDNDTERTGCAEKDRRGESGSLRVFPNVQLQAVLDAATETAIFATDTEGTITLFNRGAEKMLGYGADELVGRHTPLRFLLPEEIAVRGEEMGRETGRSVGGFVALAERARLSGADEREWSCVGRDGRRIRVRLTVTPIRGEAGEISGFLGIATDISEQTRTVEERFRARKYEALADLAGGVAHDFNNLLTGILGNLSLAIAFVPSGHKAHELLERAQKASLRSRDLTQKLLLFSRGGAPVKKPTPMGRLLKDASLSLLDGSDVRCELHIADDLWPAEVDEGQLGQVIGNLVMNANQAMPDGGTVGLLAENVVPRDGARVGESPRIRIAVSDTGSGIPEAQQGKIFDPYGSTRKDGNGLGLATVYSIIRHHGGEISVRSREGEGTSIEILLPAVPVVPAQDAEQTGPLSVGTGRVLVMDDEEYIIDMLVMVLSELGYEPTPCRDGAEAVRLYREALAAGTPFHVVIMDLTIPGEMGGKEAASRIAGIDPAARIVVASGDSSDPVMSHYEGAGFCGAIRKPFSISELGALLDRIVGRR